MFMAPKGHHADEIGSNTDLYSCQFELKHTIRDTFDHGQPGGYLSTPICSTNLPRPSTSLISYPTILFSRSLVSKSTLGLVPQRCRVDLLASSSPVRPQSFRIAISPKAPAAFSVTPKAVALRPSLSVLRSMPRSMIERSSWSPLRLWSPLRGTTRR